MWGNLLWHGGLGGFVGTHGGVFWDSFQSWGPLGLRIGPWAKNHFWVTCVGVPWSSCPCFFDFLAFVFARNPCLIWLNLAELPPFFFSAKFTQIGWKWLKSQNSAILSPNCLFWAVFLSFPGILGLRPSKQSLHFWCFSLPFSTKKLGNENWTQTFFSQTFGAPPGYPGKSRDIPPKKVWFPWFRGAYRTFRPPPLHVEDPHPTPK